MAIIRNFDGINDDAEVEAACDILTSASHGESLRAGWWSNDDGDMRNVPTKLCLIHSEISEAMEGHRKDAMDAKESRQRQVAMRMDSLRFGQWELSLYTSMHLMSFASFASLR